MGIDARASERPRGEGLPCGMLAFDDDLRVVEANDAAAEVLGYTPTELGALHVSDLLSRGALIFFNTHAFPSLTLDGHVDELYLRLRRKDGEELPVLASAARGERDGVTRSTVAFLVMRRRQLFEHELIEARNNAEAAAERERRAREQVECAHAQAALRERLASLGTLAHGIAHEINNPLTYVSTNLEVLGELLREAAPPAGEELRELVAEAAEGAARIREIVGQMRQLVRADEMPRVPVDPRAVVSLVVRMTNAQTRTRARVELALDEIPIIDGDAGRLGQILINLVINAAQAFGDRPQGGNCIRLVTKTAPDGSAVIEVSDNGPGIPPDVLSRIFEPFFTTKAVGDGSGLGLSISQGLVTSLGGTLVAESEPGRGATFRISLPRSAARTAHCDSAKPPPPPGTATKRVLVVDDDAGVAQALARVLRRYDVTIALSAEEALGYLEKTPFDLVISDVRMPGRDGLALHDAIASHTPSLARRMAFVSGAVTNETREEIERRGLRLFDKPFAVSELTEFCEKVLALDDVAST